MRRWLAALLIALFATHEAAAQDVRAFAVRGGNGRSSYEGSVRVTQLATPETEVAFMKVEWTFGGTVIEGYGVVAKDDPQVLTVSYVVPAGLGVGRYKLGPDGNLIGTLVGAQGYFVHEQWTPQP